MCKVLAVIVTYNPEVQLLIKNLRLICDQVFKVLVFDNNSENIAAVQNELDRGFFSNVEIRCNKENIGLPINYNRAAIAARDCGCEWLLILDQDSLMPSDYVKKLSRYFAIKKAAIICPQYRDINLYTEKEFQKILPAKKASFVERCISSGSINRVSIILEVGGFDEKLFIDQVDYDYCKNAREHGYYIVQVNDCIIEHSIGKSRFVKFLGTKMISYNHSPIRKYYFFRNRVYYARKYHVTPKNDIRFFTSLCKHFIVLFYEKDRVQKIKNACKGVWDGFKL